MNISYLLYRIIRKTLYIVYPKIEPVDLSMVPAEASIIVANHAQMNGPITGELHFPDPKYIWCAGQMMDLKEVPSYAFKDFWSEKPSYTHWFYRLASFVIAPLSVIIFNNAHTIGVYHDSRILSTFRTTIQRLQEGSHIIIFPEHNEKHNHIVYDFQTKFVDIAKLYYKKTGKELNFVPMYIAPKLKKMYFGNPIKYNSENPIEDERNRICSYLMEEITNIACEAPAHIVIPYRNIPKKDYPVNKEDHEHEKTDC